jgi:hypothetical protein
MSIATPPTALTEWQAAIAQAYLPMSQRDPELVRKACERMDRMREELRARIGTVEVAVELVRDARDS